MCSNIPHLQCQTRSRHYPQNQVPINHIAGIEMYVILFVKTHKRATLYIAVTKLQLPINHSALKTTYAMQGVTSKGK